MAKKESDAHFIRPTFQVFILKFLESKENQNLSPATRDMYRVALRRFAKYRKYLEDNEGRRPTDAVELREMGVNSDVRTTSEEIEDYYTLLRTSVRNIQASTMRTNMSVLTSFYEFLLVRGVVKKNPMREVPLPKVKMREIRCPKHEEVLEMIEGIENPRDALIVRTIYATGVRVAELCGMTIEDIDWDGGSIRIVGKGGKIRRVFPDATTLWMIREYLDGRDRGPVFLSSRNNGLTPISISKMFKNFAPKGVTPHTIRHSHATELFRHSHDLRLVQQCLGHESIRTTEMYLHVDTGERQKEFLKHFPLK